MTRRIRIDVATGTCDYAKLHWAHAEHHQRYVRRLEMVPKKLLCQECGGDGGEIEVVCDGQGPWFDCGWCEGTGYVFPHRRAEWLRCKAGLKKARAS